ncbi:MAG: hypothetical protein ACFHX7_00290 [Pseudomonadota bacterium]
MAEPLRSVDDMLAAVGVPRPIAVDCAVLTRGTDGYHVDVQLAKGFVLYTREVIEETVKRTIAGKRPTGKADDMESLRDAYEAMVKDSLHRTKTDLTGRQVQILQFAIIKFVIQEVRAEIDSVLKQLEDTLAQQQYSGSRSLLVTQERLTWMRQQYPHIQYRACRAIMRLLQREETRDLRNLREQFLGDSLRELANILFNPLLAASNPLEPELLVDSYALWPKQLSEMTETLEKLLSDRFPSLAVLPLRSAEPAGTGQNEVYDEVGGLFAILPFMGSSQDQKDAISEDFCWLEQPGNIRLLFDPAVHEQALEAIDGMRAQWSFKSETKKLLRTAHDARRALVDDAAFEETVAGYLLREKWSPAWAEVLDITTACAYVAGHDDKKILAKIDPGKEGVTLVVRELDELARECSRALKEETDEYVVRMLTDYSRFRLHLRYFRFAHRLFNRLSVITEPEEIQLARAGGHLYRLTGGDDVDAAEAGEPQIIHHAVLKADVRGSTVVTRELIRQNLNPAAYFSTRFFGPINQLLSVYGAVKVFIEGDAVILAIYEEDQSPDQWYAVSRACGIAKEMLDIVVSKNANARQTGLPTLEIGIGICFAAERPLFLFDENKPIMISPAIGTADRMSSCSWKLREEFESGSFNVEVLEIAEGDSTRGEKGQHHIRYNVNGILLATEGFRKLQSEIPLRKIRVKVGDAQETMFVGRFPDVLGKERDLVIREGRVGLFENEHRVKGAETGDVFYEILPNNKLANQVLEVARGAN